MLTAVNPEVDLEELKDQIRIARVKLGAALDLLERRKHEEYVLDEVADQIDDIAADIDRLASAVRQPDL